MKDFEKIKKRSLNQEKQKKERFIVHIGKTYQFHVLLFPIAIPIMIIEQIENYYYSKLKWEDRNPDKVIDKILLKELRYNSGKNEYYCNMDWVLMKEHAPLFSKKWSSKFYFKLKDYLQHEYEKEGYIKSFEDDYDKEYIIFKLKED